jgi:hypothetical protein
MFTLPVPCQYLGGGSEVAHHAEVILIRIALSQFKPHTIPRGLTLLDRCEALQDGSSIENRG